MRREYVFAVIAYVLALELAAIGGHHLDDWNKMLLLIDVNSPVLFVLLRLNMQERCRHDCLTASAIAWFCSALCSGIGITVIADLPRLGLALNGINALGWWILYIVWEISAVRANRAELRQKQRDSAPAGGKMGTRTCSWEAPLSKFQPDGSCIIHEVGSNSRIEINIDALELLVRGGLQISLTGENMHRVLFNDAAKGFQIAVSNGLSLRNTFEEAIKLCFEMEHHDKYPYLGSPRGKV